MRVALQAFVALLLFGCIPVVVKGVAANAYTIGIFRLAVATAGVAAWTLFRGELRRLPRRDAGRLLLIGFFFFMHWITLFFGIKISSASVGAIGLSTYGVSLLVLGALFDGQRARWSDIVAVIVAAAGALLVVPTLDLRNDVAAGMLLSTVSALFYATLPLLHRRAAHIPSNMRTLGQFGFALLFFLAFSSKTEWSLGARDWAGLLFLAVGVTLIGHSLWVRVTTHFSPAITSIVYYGNIPIAVVLGVLLLDEPMSGRMAAGAAMIIAGSVFGLAMRKGNGPSLALPEAQ